MLHSSYHADVTKTISQRELRNDSGEILRALDRGEDFLVTRNGVPVGELRPARRRFVSREELLEAFRGAPAIDGARFRMDVDAILDQDIEPRA
jgi:prevent-host-death family protein